MWNHARNNVLLQCLGDDVSSSEDEFEKMMKEELNDKMALHEKMWMSGLSKGCEFKSFPFVRSLRKLIVSFF